MKKWQKIFLCFISSLFLYGCKSWQPEVPAVVTAVEISLVQNGQNIRYTLVEEGQMRRLLDHLRLLESGDTAKVDPERLVADSCLIRVCLSDGTGHIYRHAGGQYLSKDSHPWKTVSRERSVALFSLLQQTM